MAQSFSYDVLRQAQPDQSGFMGLLSSPVGQGLLAAGLGALASRGSRAQAIGKGGLLGLSAFGQAQDQEQSRLMQMAQAKMRQDALAAMQPGSDGAISATPAQFIAAGFDDPSKWEAIRNVGRNRVKQTITTTGADGGQQVHSLDEYGGVTNTGLTNAPEIKTQDLGGQVVGMNPYTGQQSWNSAKTLTPDQVQDAANQPFMVKDGQIVANPAYQAYSLSRASAGAPRTNVQVTNKMGESLAGQIGPMMKESQAAAESAIKQITAANNIDKALDSGNIITGLGANARLTAAQWADSLHMSGADQKERVKNTREAVQGLAQLTLQGRQQMRGQGAITDREAEIAKQAMSGDLNMTQEELRVLTNSARRAAQYTYDQHARKVQSVADNPEYSALVPFYTVPQMPKEEPPKGGGGWGMQRVN